MSSKLTTGERTIESQSANIQLVRQMVRDRNILQPAFARVWEHVSRGGTTLVVNWAEASLELLRVNAGPACIAAFWQVCSVVGPEQLQLSIAGARAAADICRFAGGRATLACLEALPSVIRLTNDPVGVAAWWRGLDRLAREAPTLVQGVAQRVERVLAGGDGVGFADFVAAGLKATETDKVRRAAFFTLADPLAQTLLERRASVAGFKEAERMLVAFVAGLWGGDPRLKTGLPGLARRTVIASGTVLVPPIFPEVPPTQVRDLYRAASAHAQAHLTVPEVKFQIGSLKPLQIALIGLIEDARVEALTIRRFPGLRHLWSAFHVARPDGSKTTTNLMARLSRKLLDPDYADADGFIEKGYELFAAASNRQEDPAISRAIGGLLANDLGQMRIQFNAKTFVVEPAYRDDNTHLWELPEASDDTFNISIDTGRGSDSNDPQKEQQGTGAAAPRARDAGLDDRGTVLAQYPEWDMVARVERPDWTTLRDTLPVLRDPLPISPAEATLRTQVLRLVRGTVIGQSARQPLQEEGEQLDIDAAITSVIAQRGGLRQDERVYRDRRPRGRDLSTLIILDVSQSTAAIGEGGNSVLATEQLAVAALAAALEVQGDSYALRAFASAGRDDVRLTRLKDFHEALSATVSARLAGLSPGLSTRLGTALRHAGAELIPLRTTRKLVLVLTDGEPSDIDITHSRELVEDARRAVLGLRLHGIDVFGIVIDPEGIGSGSTIFGRHNTMPIRRLNELPAKLAGVYFRLAQR